MNNSALLIDRLACRALEREVALEHKPGLVTPSSRGSHSDMDQRTFQASIKALAGYFGDCVRLGANDSDFAGLQQRGRAAETAMFAATSGINTHKGAIFTLGLLCAAAGWQWTARGRLTSAALGEVVAQRWGTAILAAGDGSAAAVSATHGAQVRDRHGLPGAREQAAAGFPVLFEVTVPQLERALSGDVSADAAGLHALFATMAVLSDTNLVHRGGIDGLHWARGQADDFLRQGSVFVADWGALLPPLQEAFVARWLSPGGSADLLAAAWLLHDLQGFAGTDLINETVDMPARPISAEAVPA